MYKIFVLCLIVVSGFNLIMSKSYGENSMAKNISKNALIVDVRSPEEFIEKHITGAINIPLPEIEKRISEFGNKKREIVVYCHSGRRSKMAQDILKKAGFTNVENGGGIDQMMNQ